MCVSINHSSYLPITGTKQEQVLVLVPCTTSIQLKEEGGKGGGREEGWKGGRKGGGLVISKPDL